MKRPFLFLKGPLRSFATPIDMMTDQADEELDLRGVICPYNFVKTKIKLEAMPSGRVLSVLLDEGDPIKNVPRSVADDGHLVLSQDRIDQVLPRGSYYRVRIRKQDAPSQDA